MVRLEYQEMKEPYLNRTFGCIIFQVEAFEKAQYIKFDVNQDVLSEKEKNIGEAMIILGKKLLGNE